MTTADRSHPTADELSDRSPETVARQRARVEELRDAAETRRPFILPAALGLLALLMVVVRAMQNGPGAIVPAMFWSGLFITCAAVIEIAVFVALSYMGEAPALTVPHAALRFLAVNGFHFAVLFFGGAIGGTLGMYDPHRAAPVVIAVVLSAVFFSFLLELDLQESIVPIGLLMAAQILPSLAVQNYSRVNHAFGSTVQREFRPAKTSIAPSDTVVIPGSKPASPSREKTAARSDANVSDDDNAAEKTTSDSTPEKEPASKSTKADKGSAQK